MKSRVELYEIRFSHSEREFASYMEHMSIFKFLQQLKTFGSQVCCVIYENSLSCTWPGYISVLRS